MLLLYLFLPWLCILASGSADRDGAEQVVRGVALYQTLLFVTGTGLGLAGSLTPVAYGATTGAAVAILAVPAWKGRPRALPRFRALRTRRGVLIALTAVTILLMALLQLARDAAWGTGHGDGLWYHLPRIVRWARQGNFDAWVTPTWAQVGLPVGADVVLGAKVFLGLGWAGAAYVTAMLTLGAVACVYVAARDLGFGRTRAVLAALLFASFPAVGRRVGAINSDIAAAFPLMAAYVVLVKGHGRASILVFLFLNGLGVACRPTVAPAAAVLALLAIWRSRTRIRMDAWTLGGLLAGFAAILASYWPVYRTFHDFLGGPFGRAHATDGVGGFARAVAVNTVQWLMEPLGYIVGPLQERGRAFAWSVLQVLGAPFPGHPYPTSAGMRAWTDYRLADVGRSGVVALLALPLLVRSLPAGARRVGLPAWVLAFVGLSGLVYLQPWSSRFTVVVLAGYALLWASARIFVRHRWWLPVIVVTSALVSLAVLVKALATVAEARSRDAPSVQCIPRQERADLARDLGGRPLLILTGGSVCDSLIPGPDRLFDIRYVMCQSDGDWIRAFREAGYESNRLAVGHLGQAVQAPGPIFSGPGIRRCDDIERATLDTWLERAGWRLRLQGPVVDIWERTDG